MCGPDENEVISAVIGYFENKGYNVDNSCNTTERGIDIILSKESDRVLIEAKGNTTTKNTANKGKEFDSAQVTDHIAKAIRKAMEMRDQNRNARIGMAFPDNQKHRKGIAKVKKSLCDLSIEIYWVDSIKNVKVDDITE